MKLVLLLKDFQIVAYSQNYPAWQPHWSIVAEVQSACSVLDRTDLSVGFQEHLIHDESSAWLECERVVWALSEGRSRPSLSSWTVCDWLLHFRPLQQFLLGRPVLPSR